MRKPVLISTVALLGIVVEAVAEVGIPVSVADRLRGAERVIVATVGQVEASFETNRFGDQLIVSHVTLRVEEALKGESSRVLSVDVEGGTVGNLTLVVSSLPRLTAGERAVFFLSRNEQGKYVPHLRGQGILKLRADDRVKGSSLDLNTIRQMAASLARQ